MCPAILMCPPEHLRTDLIDSSQTQTAEWLVPSGEQQGLRRYVQTIRERFKLIVADGARHDARGRALRGHRREDLRGRARRCSSPPCRGTTRRSPTLGQITASSDPTRDVHDRRRPGHHDRRGAGRRRSSFVPTAAPRSLLKDVKAEPIAQSNLVAVTAKGSSAVSAQNLANTFADSAVEDRTEKFHEQVDKRIKALEPRVKTIQEAPGQAADPLKVELARLRTLRAGDNPTHAGRHARRQADLALMAEAQPEHLRGHRRRARARRRRRVRRPDARPAPAPRGAAARALPPAGPRPHPRGEPRPQPRTSSPRTSSRPPESRPTGRCARRSARRAAARRAARAR